MPHYIVKVDDDQYLEWSTIVDAPITYVVDRDQALSEWGKERIERADNNGSSALDFSSAEELMLFNRAGYKESWLPPEKIKEVFANEQANKQNRRQAEQALSNGQRLLWVGDEDFEQVLIQAGYLPPVSDYALNSLREFTKKNALNPMIKCMEQIEINCLEQFVEHYRDLDQAKIDTASLKEFIAESNQSRIVKCLTQEEIDILSEALADYRRIEQEN